MQTLPQTNEEYTKSVAKRINAVEKLSDDVSGTDERLDITNALLIELTKLMSRQTVTSIKTFPLFLHGQITLETGPKPLKKDSFPLKQGVLIKADNDNTGTVYIGNNDNISNSDGFRLERAESVTIEIDDLSKILGFGSVAGQKIYWIGV